MALAFMPTERGVSAPHTVWSDRGIKGTVTGKVVTSLDQTKGVSGAYVALVNPMNQNQEYANTTTDADGSYRFTNVNATYSSVLLKGPDGTADSYNDGLNAYMVYVNLSMASEGYSGAFGVDTNHTNVVVDPVVIYAGLDEVASPEPTATEQPTTAPTQAPVTGTPVPPTETPTAEGQGPSGMLLIAAIVVLAVILVAAVYFIFLRKR